MTTQLTNEQQQFFVDHGYLILPAVFNADKVQQMREEADAILELIINSSLANRRKSGRLDIRQTLAGQQVVRKIQPINDLGLVLAQASDDNQNLSVFMKFFRTKVKCPYGTGYLAFRDESYAQMATTLDPLSLYQSLLYWLCHLFSLSGGVGVLFEPLPTGGDWQYAALCRAGQLCQAAE